jgi:hypothetical protein
MRLFYPGRATANKPFGWSREQVGISPFVPARLDVPFGGMAETCVGHLPERPPEMSSLLMF